MEAWFRVFFFQDGHLFTSHVLKKTQNPEVVGKAHSFTEVLHHWSYRGDAVVKSPCCSCKGPGFDSQHPYYQGIRLLFLALVGTHTK